MSAPEQAPINFKNRILQHAFLQALMQRGYMPEHDAKEMYKRIANTDNDSGYLTFIGEIGNAISFSGFEIRRGKWPGDNHWYIGFINTESDDLSKGATRFRTKEGKPDIRYAAYFRALMEKIVSHQDPAPSNPSTPNLGLITLTDALSLDPSLPPAPTPTPTPETTTGTPSELLTYAPLSFRLSEKEHALELFVEDGWLAPTPNVPRAYSLGPRSFLELAHMLHDDADMAPGPNLIIKPDI